MALFVAAIMLIGPALRFGNDDLSPADSASAQTTGRELRAGWANFVGGVKTLNPLTMIMGQEYQLVVPCYSYLLTYDKDNNVIGDLATKWTVSPDGKIWHFWITRNATFYDKNKPVSEHQPVTVDDVIYSFQLNQDQNQTIYHYYFPWLPGTSGRLVESMTKITNWEMEFKLRAPFAPFQQALLGVPILPKYVWQTEAWNWNNYNAQKGIPPILGSGPFYYGLDDLKSIGTVGFAEMYANPTWFGTIERGWQSHVYKFTIKSETDQSAIQDYYNDVIDVIISPTAEQFFASTFPQGTHGLPDPSDKFRSSQGFVCYDSMNQLTLEDRAKYGIGGPGDYNSQILQDPTVVWALKMSVNKTSMVQNDLLGAGSPAESLIPSVSPWVYDYGSGPGETEIPANGNPAAARQLLLDAGWHYNEVGTDLLATPDPNDERTVYPLCQIGGTEVLRFRLFSPDQYIFFDGMARRVVITGQQAGFDLQYPGPTPTNTAITIWYTGDYELLMWDWWMNPNSEPSLDCMEVYTSTAIGGSSDCNYDNATFDALYFQSLQETNLVARHELINELQRMAYENGGCWPTVYRDNLYGIHSVAPNYWAKASWGNWLDSYFLCFDSNYPWLFTQIYPEDNPAPNIYSFAKTYNGTTTTDVTLTAGVSDNTAGLMFRWNFGDGSMSDWSDSATAIHRYATDGIYNAYFMANESTSADGFISSARAKVTVIDTSNGVPTGLSFTVDPSLPDTGTLVKFNGTATDPNLDALSFSWDFGDGTSVLGQNVTHQYSGGEGLKTVYMYVDDGHLGSVPRPVNTSKTVQVSKNSPPTIAVGDYPSVPFQTMFTYNIAASDANSRDHLTFTWVWGDGPISVTTTQSCQHQYKWVRDYTLIVWADDGTGLPEHNVSDTGEIHVYRGTNSNPSLTSYLASTVAPMRILQPVNFTAKVIDPDGDIADVTFDFGDGTPVVKVTQSAANTTVYVVHTYLADGVYYPSLTYTDGTVAPISAYSDDFGWWVTVNSWFTLSIAPGWNFVTSPVLGSYTANTLPGLQAGDMVAGWNANTQKYDKLFIKGVSPDFTLEPSTGYWINVPASRTLALTGSVPVTPQTRTITLPGASGWVNLAFITVAPDWKASNIPGMYSGGGTVDMVAWWNPATQKYTGLYLPGVGGDFTLIPGQSYWVSVIGSGTFTYTP